MAQCLRCGEQFLTLSQKLSEKIYGKDGDKKGLTKLCAGCRRKAVWEGLVVKR